MWERIALIISNSNYQDQTLSRLQEPKADVQALATVLSDPKIGSFSVVETVVDQPSLEIRRRIGNLFHSRKRDDVILLYVVGHALLDGEGQLYLAAADTKLDALDETAIPAAYITGCMDRSFSRQQILILDCVNSAASSEESAWAPGSSVGTGDAFQGKGYWRIVLAASDRTQYWLTGDRVLGDGESSLFTRYLIQSLRTGAADLDGDGRVGIGELHKYFHDQVSRHSLNQQPHIWRYNERDEFIIAYHPRKVEHKRQVKWDIIAGAIMAPLATIILGRYADLGESIAMAGIVFFLYALLYWAHD